MLWGAMRLNYLISGIALIGVAGFFAFQSPETKVQAQVHNVLSYNQGNNQSYDQSGNQAYGQTSHRASIRVNNQANNQANTQVSNRARNQLYAQAVNPAANQAAGAFNVRRCINLGNALEAETEGAWGYTIQAKHLARIRAAGFDTVRLPVRWDLMTEARPPYRIKAAHMERVKQVVGQAQAQGLGVIIDVHHYTPLFENIDRELPRLVAIWNQIATVFKNAPDNVYFEPLNEPFPKGSAAQVNRAYQAVIPVIRRTNPTRKLILGGHGWSHEGTMKDVKYPRDPNIVATFHDYQPHEFTHQGNTWSDNPTPLGRKWGSRKDGAELAKVYATANDFARQSRLPILVGEFGVIDKVNDRERAEWIYHRRRQIEAQGYSWCVWDFAGAFSIYDTAREQWKPGMLEALMR